MKSLWTAPAVLRFLGKGCSIQELDAFVYWKIVVCKPARRFRSREWLRRPGGQGGFRPPPYAPLDPLYPLQTAEGYPRTPLVPPRARPLVSRPTGSVSGTPFGLAWGQQPIGCRGGYAPCMAPMPGRVPLHRGAAVAAPCRHSKDKLAPWSRGRDQLRRRRQWPSQGRT